MVNKNVLSALISSKHTHFKTELSNIYILNPDIFINNHIPKYKTKNQVVLCAKMTEKLFIQTH